MISAYLYTANVFDCKKLLFREFLTGKKISRTNSARRSFNSLLEVNKYLKSSDFFVIHKTDSVSLT